MEDKLVKIRFAQSAPSALFLYLYFILKENNWKELI
jgi:hypothetical protein